VGVQADTVVPEPGNPPRAGYAWRDCRWSQALNRYSYVINNPLRYIDPSGLFSEGGIMKYLGAGNWEEVLAFFNAGGELEGRWGWLATLRRAELGDLVDFFQYYDRASQSGLSMVLGGSIVAVANSLYIQDTAGGMVLANEAARMADEYLIRPCRGPDLPSLSGEVQGPVLYELYYAREQYVWPEFTLEEVDWLGAGVDVLGIAGDIRFWTGTPPGAALLATSYGADMAYIAHLREHDPAALHEEVAFLELERQLGLGQVPGAGAAVDAISLMTNLAQGVTWQH
jgi:hypothetical protein